MIKIFTLCVVSLFVLSASANAAERSGERGPYWEQTSMDVYCESPCENALWLPGGFTRDYTVEYTSSNPAVAEYVESGLCVIGHTAGTAQITGKVTTSDGQVYSASFPVTVLIPQALSHDGDKLVFDKYYYTIGSGNTATFFANSGLSDEFRIPGKISDGSTIYTVTAIGNAAFKNSDVKKVTIPVTTHTIGDEAFANCYPLEQVEFFSLTNVKRIGDKAFFQCTNLGRPDFPESLESIGDLAFMECFKVDKFVLGPNVSAIGDGAFASCLNLECIDVKGNSNFRVLLPSGDGGPGILLTHDETELLAFPNKVYEYYWFFDDSTPYEIPKRVKKIRPYAFCGVTRLRAVTIPATVSEIGAYAFNGCMGLSEIALPESITRIEDHCFDFCEGLTKVSVGAGVSYVGECAFPAVGPKEFRCPSVIPPAAMQSADPTTDSFCELPSDATLYVPEASIPAYKSAAIWSYYPQIVALPQSCVETVNTESEATTDLVPFYTIDGRYVGNDPRSLPSGVYVNARGEKIHIQ